jgi:hypothetical protein
VRLFGVISTAVLVLAIGTTAPVCAQEQHDQQPEQKAKPAQDNKPAQPQKPARQAAKPTAPVQKSAPQEKSSPQRQNNAKQEQPSQQRQSSAKQEKPSAQHQQTPNHQTARTQPQQQQQTQQAQRSGGGKSAGRIPDDRFRANFGREHTFRVSQGDYRGRRFQYGGYSFGFVDPWPANWLYTQDVFVVEIGGVYYLCNATYPGVNVALSVTI